MRSGKAVTALLRCCLCSLCGLAACGGGVARVELDPPSLRLGVRGQVAKVHASPRDRNGKSLPSSVCAWRSSDEKVATVRGANDAEITATQRLLDDAGLTHTERYFRPFGRGGRLGPHLLSERARDVLVAGHYTCVLWNSVPRDWEDPAGWVDTARSHIDADGSGHTVVVLHDLPTGAMDHLERFLDALDADGHPISEALPAHCLPIVRGVPQPGCEAYVAAAAPA